MHQASYDAMARLIRTYLKPYDPLRILDVGSFAVADDGSGGLSYRMLVGLVPHWTYEGLDLVPGPNVDHVLEDPYRFPFQDASYDVILSGQAFEHIPYFWLTWAEMVRCLKPGGHIFLIAPGCGGEHRYPVDCWRFYRDGFVALGALGGLEVLEATTHWDQPPWLDTVGAYRKPLTERSG